MTSRFIEKIHDNARKRPEHIAYFTSREGESITYGELDSWSDSVAAFLSANAPTGKPVVVH